MTREPSLVWDARIEVQELQRPRHFRGLFTEGPGAFPEVPQSSEQMSLAWCHLLSFGSSVRRDGCLEYIDTGLPSIAVAICSRLFVLAGRAGLYQLILLCQSDSDIGHFTDSAYRRQYSLHHTGAHPGYSQGGRFFRL